MPIGTGTALALAAGGKILGALGKDKSKATPSQEKSGVASLTPEQQDWVSKTLFPQLQAYNSTPYKGLPRRAINSSDADPIFGSSARMQYAGQKLDEARNAEQAPVAQASPQITPDLISMLRDEVIGRNLAANTPFSARGYSGDKTKDAAMRLGTSGTGSPEDYAALARLSGGNDFGNIDTSKVAPWLQAMMAGG